MLINEQQKIENILVQLVGAALREGLVNSEDQIYLLNRLCHRLDLSGFLPDSDLMEMAVQTEAAIPELLDQLVDYAVSRCLIEDLTDLRDMLQSDLMDLFLDKPSVIQTRFEQLASEDARSATDWFYQLSQTSNYIQTRQIARNVIYNTPSPYGELTLSINLAKPEKNPRDIAAARLQHNTGYPRCQLCVENEGYAGRVGYPARSNHRMLRLQLGGERWYLQFSPYAYYPEHCIVLSREHRDMHIDRKTLDNLLSFVQQFPHYFVGANADLPIVGGSILSHDHYQGGRYELPMARAATLMHFPLPTFPDLHASIINWPMAVIRLSGRDTAEIAAAADYILRCWRKYHDPSAQIVAEDENGPHNTLTPIARKRGSDFEMDLVLRNNRQSEEHPLGIFHPHHGVHHIKKENIGLIEVMGLAVLPARLLTELEEVEQYLQGKNVLVSPVHQPWAESLRRQQHGSLSPEEARKVVRDGVAEKFLQVLTDASVFKPDKDGREALQRFLITIGSRLQEV